MEVRSFLKKLSIKQKIVMLIVLVSVLISGISLFISLTDTKKELLNTGETKIKNIVEIADKIIDTYYTEAQNGTISTQTAQKEAIYEINHMNYQGKNYVWITDYDDHMLAHPKLQGESISDVADVNGIKFFHDGVVLAKAKGDGFINYHWTKPGENPSKVFPKTSYFKSFPQWKWVVATGIYTDEIDKIIGQITVQILLFNLIALIIVVVGGIFTVVKDIVNSMKKITVDLDDSSKSVAAASSQLQAASEKLAEGSTEQASSIQETSSTLEETSSMIQQNNENTKQAASLAQKSKDYASKSTQKMLEMTSAMQKLQNSSEEISKIIKVIDDIAFQTNLLSLNAAVEAARAGDIGKGFAVVAEEVRTLAQRSAQAAKDTTVIIEHNINLSQNSAEITKLVQDSITEIDVHSKKLSDLLEEISVATNEQSQGVEQINKAVSQMEMVINSNATTAEESAAASKALYAQTLSMDKIISQLKDFVEGVKDAAQKVSYQPKKLEKRTEPVGKVSKFKPNKSIQKKPEVPKLTVAKKELPPKDIESVNPKDIIPLGDDVDNF